MSKDYTCPFCKEEFDWDHSEPLAEDQVGDIECPGCEKPIEVSASYLVTYSATCGKDAHTFKTCPEPFADGWVICTRCDHMIRRDRLSPEAKIDVV